MERLFTMLKIGDIVQIRGERDEQVARVFGSQTDATLVTIAQNKPETLGQREAKQCAVGMGN